MVASVLMLAGNRLHGGSSIHPSLPRYRFGHYSGYYLAIDAHHACLIKFDIKFPFLLLKIKNQVPPSPYRQHVTNTIIIRLLHHHHYPTTIT